MSIIPAAHRATAVNEVKALAAALESDSDIHGEIQAQRDLVAGLLEKLPPTHEAVAKLLPIQRILLNLLFDGGQLRSIEYAAKCCGMDTGSARRIVLWDNNAAGRIAYFCRLRDFLDHMEVDKESIRTELLHISREARAAGKFDAAIQALKLLGSSTKEGTIFEKRVTVGPNTQEDFLRKLAERGGQAAIPSPDCEVIELPRGEE